MKSRQMGEPEAWSRGHVVTLLSHLFILLARPFLFDASNAIYAPGNVSGLGRSGGMRGPLLRQTSTNHKARVSFAEKTGQFDLNSRGGRRTNQRWLRRRPMTGRVSFA